MPETFVKIAAAMMAVCLVQPAESQTLDLSPLDMKCHKRNNFDGYGDGCPDAGIWSGKEKCITARRKKFRALVSSLTIVVKCQWNESVTLLGSMGDFNTLEAEWPMRFVIPKLVKDYQSWRKRGLSRRQVIAEMGDSGSTPDYRLHRCITDLY